MNHLRSPRAFILCLAYIPLMGCSGGDDDTTQTVFELQSESYDVVVEPEPAPAQVGNNTLHVDIHNTEGAAVTGAVLDVSAWMTAHGHGSDSTPTVTEMTEGHYMVRDLVLQMPGSWAITLDVTVGGATESLEFDLDVR